MKLLVHNLLSSKFLKGVNKGFPLILRATQTEKLELDAGKEERMQFVCQMIPRLDWMAFKSAANDIDPEQSGDLPNDLPQDWEKDANLLQKVYALLVGIEIIEGELECPETHRVFPINEGIPNMLVRADEVDT